MMRRADHVPKKRMAEAFDALHMGDDTFAREVFGTDTVMGRALVHETAFGEAELPEVLDWEKATEVIEQANAWAGQPVSSTTWRTPRRCRGLMNVSMTCTTLNVVCVGAA